MNKSEEIRMLPSSVEAEKGVLSILLQNPDFVVDALEHLTTEHFYLPANQILWDVITSIAAERGIVSMVTVQQRLIDRGLLDQVGGPGVVLDLGVSTQLTGYEHLIAYCAILSEKLALRKLADVANGTMISVYDVEPAVAIAEKAEAAMQEVRSKHLSKRRKELVHASAAVTDTIDLIEESIEAAGKTGLIGFPSGFKKIDRLTAGYRRKTMLVIGARPSVGKTALAITLFHKFCIQDRLNCLYITLEGAKETIITRIASQVGNISTAGIMRGKNPERIGSSLKVVGDAPFHIYRPTDMNMIPMEAHVAAKAYDVVFIDYMQKLRFGPAGKMQFREQMNHCAEMAKDWSEQYNCLVVLMAQLRRGAEDGAERTPGLADFKETGTIEEAADYVLFPHRPDARIAVDTEGKYISMDTNCQLILAKNKEGSIGSIDATFDRPLMRYAERVPAEETTQTTLL